jgi:hypothetical protein
VISAKKKRTVGKYKFYKFLQSLPKPENPWKDISIKFIIELLPSLREGRAFDAILIIVNRYSKMAHFISITIDINTPVFAELIYYKIVKYHDISKLIISEKNFFFFFQMMI